MSISSRMIDWRTPREVARLAGFAAILQALILAFFIAGTHGWISRGLTPTTTDYASFYAAGRLADQGRAVDAYDHDRHLAAEEAATAQGIGYQYFFNPPTYLLIMAPFAWLPYMASFLAMQGVTLALWLWLGGVAAGGGATARIALLAVPSVWWVLGLGQNSFLSAGLMAAGMLLLPGRPVLAGVAFGALCYKPHLGLMIPVALLAARQWRAIGGAALSVATAVVLTTALFGVAVWHAFVAMAQRNVSGAIDAGKVLFAGRIDPTGAAQLIGVGPAHARIVWLLCLLAVTACVAWLWRGIAANPRHRAAACAGLAASVAIAAPFMLMYDLVMASLGAAWLVRAARQDGFLPGEKLVLLVAALADLLAAHPVVASTHIPFGALPSPLLLALAVRRRLAG